MCNIFEVNLLDEIQKHEELKWWIYIQSQIRDGTIVGQRIYMYMALACAEKRCGLDIDK